jgi:hypothetical protein
MHIMKLVKKLFLSISSLFAYSLLATPVFAESVNPCDSKDLIAKALCSLGTDTAGTVQKVIIFIVVLAVIVALLYLLYGGIKWITSKGEKTEVESARNHIMAAITGLIVVFLAIFIVSLVLAAFGLKFENLIIPTITK